MRMVADTFLGNFLFAYTVWKIKVCITFPKELANCYMIYRSYSDFRELDSKLRVKNF
jgi:hypothetical protein